MSSLPEAKLDVLLAHHASLEAELLGQVSSERYVQITRELAEIGPLIVELAQADLGQPTANVVFADWKSRGTLASA